jgi:hypothetical protein
VVRVGFLWVWGRKVGGRAETLAASGRRNKVAATSIDLASRPDWTIGTDIVDRPGQACSRSKAALI